MERGRGLLFWLGVKARTPFDERWNGLLGRYKFCDNNVGMIPLMVRAMQNNLKSSLEEIVIIREGEELYIDYVDGGENYHIHIGLYGYERNVINLRGEPYVIWALGEAVVDTVGETHFKIELIPSETASVRRLLIKRKRDRIIIEFSETPNDRVAKNFLEQNAKANSTLAFGVNVIEKRLGEGAVANILKKTFNPTLVGADTSLEEYEKILDEEKKRIAEDAEKVAGIKLLVDRFFKDEERTFEVKEPQSIEKIVKKSISDILGKISGKARQIEENDN